MGQMLKRAVGWGLIGLVAAAAMGEAVDPRRVESAIQGGLSWLASTQIPEGSAAGSWACENSRYQPAVAALAGLAFLANGYLPGPEGYGPVVQQALRYVVGRMAPDGYWGQGDRSGMYIHAMCTLFALSALGMLPERGENQDLAENCRKAVGVVLEAQKAVRSSVEQGGWRYTPDAQESDLSATAWQLLVLHTARQCGYGIEPEVFDDALRYVARGWRVTEEGVAGWVYRPGVSRDPEISATAMALFLRSLFDLPETTETGAARRWVARFPPAWGGPEYGGYFYFAGFYRTLGLFQTGGKEWRRYQRALERVLTERQRGDGSWPFPPDAAPQARQAGPAYATAMAVLMLSVEKQYLPLYQRQRTLFRPQEVEDGE